mmetsp:Transcript_51502/g.129210  ORF Transcript_51502/g.129210 Transcript_51502/m.129210 type:complete len:240 (+) Transcript_51502:196-915(+)
MLRVLLRVRVRVLVLLVDSLRSRRCLCRLQCGCVRHFLCLGRIPRGLPRVAPPLPGGLVLVLLPPRPRGRVQGGTVLIHRASRRLQELHLSRGERRLVGRGEGSGQRAVKRSHYARAARVAARVYRPLLKADQVAPQRHAAAHALHRRLKQLAALLFIFLVVHACNVAVLLDEVNVHIVGCGLEGALQQGQRVGRLALAHLKGAEPRQRLAVVGGELKCLLQLPACLLGIALLFQTQRK